MDIVCSVPQKGYTCSAKQSLVGLEIRPKLASVSCPSAIVVRISILLKRSYDLLSINWVVHACLTNLYTNTLNLQISTSLVLRILLKKQVKSSVVQFNIVNTPVTHFTINKNNKYSAISDVLHGCWLSGKQKGGQSFSVSQFLYGLIVHMCKRRRTRFVVLCYYFGFHTMIVHFVSHIIALCELLRTEVISQFLFPFKLGLQIVQ